MSIRKLVAAVAMSAAVLTSGVALAAGSDQPLPPTFEGQLAEAKAAAGQVNSSTTFRFQRTTAITFLKVAESLASRGSRDKAQDYLNFARGELGLAVAATPGGQGGNYTPSAPKFRR